MALDPKLVWQHDLLIEKPAYYITTQDGTVIDLHDPRTECFELDDIAHGMAWVNRFCGQTSHPWSDLQHSLLCLKIYEIIAVYNLSELIDLHMLGTAILFHDASEAYLGDIPGPVKKLCPDYQAIERRIQNAIAEKFGFIQYQPGSVVWQCLFTAGIIHQIDMIAYEYENAWLRWGKLPTSSRVSTLIHEEYNILRTATPDELKILFKAQYDLLNDKAKYFPKLTKESK